ncbi:unnamed protein product [Meloidogyne enterolobii]|uniref:Uncharacterized protein n=1 Tax=Meloidogyne enterolobii TaxID=390850 RepID=A0ACB0Y332_MELEN
MAEVKCVFDTAEMIHSPRQESSFKYIKLFNITTFGKKKKERGFETWGYIKIREK